MCRPRKQGRWSQSERLRRPYAAVHDLCGPEAGKGYMFPPGAAPEEQAEQNVMWNAVIFWSALFWHLPLLATLEGSCLTVKAGFRE